MTETKSADPRRHWLKPISGKWRGGHHLALWPQEAVKGRKAKAIALHGVHFYFSPSGEAEGTTYSSVEGQDLEHMLDRASAGKGTLTVWIPGGWDHLVLTGLADLLDKGAITYRYCAIDTQRVLIRGLWRGKSVILTSLSNWTGGTWDQWRTKTVERGVELYLSSIQACADISRDLGCGSLAASAGAAGMLFWRSTLGPRVKGMEAPPKKGDTPVLNPATQFVGPIPSRPKAARIAERHCAYGLVHRQMRCGLVDEPIYCCDVSSCYLLSLVTTPIPVMYSKYLYRPSVEELCEWLGEHTGCALVQLRSPADAFPVRRGSRIAYASGEYWTWLAGQELGDAAAKLLITQCEAAYMWTALLLRQSTAKAVLSIQDSLADNGQPLQSAAWRSMYSQMVGRFAAWRREWKDCKATHGFGRWATWFGLDADTGQYVSYRSIAGRTQKLTAKQDASDSVPLLFACVTAHGRWIVQRLCEKAGTQNVLAIEADAVWLNGAGWQNLQRLCASKGIAPDLIRCKETFDRAWMTGKSIAVVEQKGKQYLRCPGIPSDIVVGSAGQVEWEQSEHWSDSKGPDKSGAVKRYPRRYSAREVIRHFGKPAETLPFYEDIIDPMLSPQLLEPVEGSVKSEGQ